MMQWSEVVEHPSLRNLPYKIETNHYGQIVMSPRSRIRSRYQGLIVGLLYSMRSSGGVYSECPIETPKGVKVPDAAWVSEAHLSRAADDELTFKNAPELCVDVLSRSNNILERDGNKDLYFQLGAQEVWTCDLSGNVNFFNRNGIIECSQLFPQFPAQLI